MQSYTYDTQTIIRYAQSSKCSYVKFSKNFGELFHNFGAHFNNFGELFHIIGELVNNVGELLTNWVLAMLEDLVNFGQFWSILAN